MNEVFSCIDTHVKRSSNHTKIINQEKQEIKKISSCVGLDFVKQIFSRIFSYFGRAKMKKQKKTYENGTGKVRSMSAKHNICYMYYYYSLSMFIEILWTTVI